MHREIDSPIAQLILDLESRGLLERTLVVVASEFSRDALIEGIPGSNARDQATEKVDYVSEMKHYGLPTFYRWYERADVWGWYETRICIR